MRIKHLPRAVTEKIGMESLVDSIGDFFNGDKHKQSREEIGEQVHQAGMRIDVAGLAAFLKNTIANKDYLSKRQFTQEKVKAQGIVEFIAIGGKVPTDVVAQLQKLGMFERNAVGALGPAYTRFTGELMAVYNLLRFPKNPGDGVGLIKIYDVEVIPKLKALKHPGVEAQKWMKTIGGYIGGVIPTNGGESRNKHHFQQDMHYGKAGTDGLPEVLPPLTKEMALGIGEALIVILGRNFKESDQGNYRSMFTEVARLREKLPSYADGDFFDQTKVTDQAAKALHDHMVFNDIFSHIDSEAEQGHDPIFKLDKAYNEMFRNSVVGLVRWINRTIVK